MHDKIYIGIDFSIKSTAICLVQNYIPHWISIADNINFSNKPYKVHKDLSSINGISICSYDRDVPKGNYIEEQKYKLGNAKILADLATSQIVSVCRNFELRNVHIAFEGYSFGSKGNAFIDLISYNTFLKSNLMTIFKVNPITIYSPSTIKKNFTGSGRAKKEDMFKSFMEIEDYQLRSTEVFRYLSGLDLDPLKLPKPIDDLIDSYAIAMMLATTEEV